MSEGPARRRLFVAVALPPDVLERLESAIAPLRELLANARWAPVTNQHATLRFLGSVEAERVDAIASACAEVAASGGPARLSVDGFGAFPRAGRARVVWAGLDDPGGTLTRLALGLGERLAPLGFPPEERSFTPHLTLARLRSPAPASAFLDQAGFRSEPFEVGEFHLFRSHLSPRGARYEILRTFVLEGEPPTVFPEAGY